MIKKKKKTDSKTLIRSFRLSQMDLKKIRAYAKFKKITNSEAIRRAINTLDIAF